MVLHFKKKVLKRKNRVFTSQKKKKDAEEDLKSLIVIRFGKITQ